jgi:hypothetical protein
MIPFSVSLYTCLLLSCGGAISNQWGLSIQPCVCVCVPKPRWYIYIYPHRENGTASIVFGHHHLRALSVTHTKRCVLRCAALPYSLHKALQCVCACVCMYAFVHALFNQTRGSVLRGAAASTAAVLLVVVVRPDGSPE